MGYSVQENLSDENLKAICENLKFHGFLYMEQLEEKHASIAPKIQWLIHPVSLGHASLRYGIPVYMEAGSAEMFHCQKDAAKRTVLPTLPPTESNVSSL